MDRDVAVRASRRRLALDAAAFERDREAMLVSQLEDVLAEADGPQVDALLFAQMSQDEIALVRAALGEYAFVNTDEEAVPDDNDVDFSPDFDDGEAESSDAGGDGVEEEVARLEGEIESSRQIQAALERYLDLLSAPPAG